MDTQKNSGFTIIEVIMFLAISSLLGVGILATASASINAQRYQDSSRSFYSHLQSEYSRVINVENPRSGGDLRCSPSDAVVDISGGGGASQSRGTSECSIIGRLVDISDDGTTVHSEPVYATVDVMNDVEPPISDVAALQDSRLVTALPNSNEPELNKTDYTLEWQTRVVDTDGSAMPMRLLIVRSPLSGMIRTYAASGQGLTDINNGTAAARDLIGQTKEITACVDPNGLFSAVRQKSGVRIAELASSTSGLSMIGGDTCQ